MHQVYILQLLLQQYIVNKILTEVFESVAYMYIYVFDLFSVDMVSREWGY